jgi:tRNA(Ile)-lysidine synthase
VIVETPLPVGAVEFERLMAPLEPFETLPFLAVAVSGGRDSLALALLSRDWVRARKGDVLALIVDHGLRPEAQIEALAAQAILAEHDIDAAILRWIGDKPSTGLQSAARRNRYRLLRSECRRRGILHLLLAHHADDQAETVAMRAARRSGPDGLSGMAALMELPELRLLRPLLGISRSRLTSTLRSHGVRWLDDPSNADPRFERVRLRMGPLPRTSATEPVVRQGREKAVALAAVDLLEFDQAGAVAIDRDRFARLESGVQVRLLSRVVQALGGREHPPRQERLLVASRRLCQPAAGGKSGRAQDFTLSGCRLNLRAMSRPKSPQRSREVSQNGRLRWIVRPENGRNGGQPLVPAAFFAPFACGTPATTHLEYHSTPTDIGQ